MLPADAAPAVAVVVGQEVLVREHVVGEVGGGLEGGDEGGPALRRRVEEEHAAVEQGMGALEGGVVGAWDGRRRREGRGVRDRRVGAVGGVPVAWRPGVVVEVADAGVGGGEPVGGGERGVEDGVDVAEEGDVGVEEDDGVVGGEGEDAEFRPGVFEAGGDEGGGVVGRREKGCGGLDLDEGIEGAFELEGAEGGGGEGGRHEDEERVGGLVLAEGVGEGEDAGEVGVAREEGGPRAVGAGRSH